ncbi:hypothetical protein J6590_039653 [Homalodisca vitripennis]|nr:hypothetical protein J6590_039653 [Homalodisca vitripennis]
MKERAGMIDAACKIYQSEGASGLYRGFWVSSVQIVSGVMYIATYEGVRHILTQHNASASTKSLLGGGCASVVGQTVIVPFDILSQHLMVLGVAESKYNKNKAVLNPLGIFLDPRKSKLRLTLDIAQAIYRTDGIRGFYRGYIASLCTYVPNSALWWAFYHLYQEEGCSTLSDILTFRGNIFLTAEELEKLFPPDTSHLMIQCVAGTLGGFTTTLITNPMDTMRARLQEQKVSLKRILEMPCAGVSLYLIRAIASQLQMMCTAISLDSLQKRQVGASLIQRYPSYKGAS